jgi:glycosyltransferase involved in cell wall biosynthesis
VSSVLGAPNAPAERVDAATWSLPPGHPQVSVVVPTCGRPELLARCLIALFAQSMPRADFEIVVVDDGRSETTRSLVDSLAAEAPGLSVRYLRPMGAKGPAAARNAGWSAARSDLVAFTDDDTVPEPGWLAIGTAAMRAGRWAALAGRVLVPRPPGATHAPTDHEQMTRGLERATFVTANAFVARRALQRIQGFDERFGRPWREDTDLEFRLREEAGPVGRCDAAVVLHPVRPERWGVSLRQQKNAYYEALLYRKHPRRYRAMADGAPPWGHYAVVALTLAALLLWWLDVPGSAAVAALLAVLAVLRFAARRLRGTTRAPAHVLEMLLTSFAIPFLSVGWRLRGALRWRVWFF